MIRLACKIYMKTSVVYNNQVNKLDKDQELAGQSSVAC